jgi:anthranilate phosphoribosyltransferase
MHGAGGLDELTGEGENAVVALEDGRTRRFSVVAADAHLSHTPNASLRGGSAAENAQALEGLLEKCEDYPDYAEAVTLNAAAALVVAGAAGDLPTGARLAQQSLREGRALAALDALIDITNE